MSPSRSHRLRWLLEELGLDYELERLQMTREDLKNDAYLAKNPLGLVPTLEDGETVVFESGAIVEYLLETSDARSRPSPDPSAADRARIVLLAEQGVTDGEIAESRALARPGP